MKKITIVSLSAFACVLVLSCAGVRADDQPKTGSSLKEAAKAFMGEDNLPAPPEAMRPGQPDRGPGRGMGRGPADGQGRGAGRGPMNGQGPAGPPEGRGPGFGPGRGGPPEGRGPGMGPGRGPGSGRGPWAEMSDLRESDPEMFALVQSDMEYSRKTMDILDRYNRASTDEKADIRKELEDTLNKHFEARQQRRELEVRRMEQQIQKLREAIEERNKSRDAVIENYLKRLLNEEDKLEF